MTWVFTVSGVGLVVLALRDIYATLWHPRGLGTVSRLIFSTLWRAMRPLGRGKALESVGPVGLAMTAVVWAVLVVVGWALIYLPHMPDGFLFSSPLDQQDSSNPVAALYVSMVAVATLGFGDITPEYSTLRLLVPIQALIGFVLFTAAISWILQVYPALVRRRATARQLDLLRNSDGETTVRDGEATIAYQVLDSITASLATVDMDLAQYKETYYFRDPERHMSLAATGSYALQLAAAGSQSETPEVRSAAKMLDIQAAHLARRLDEFLRTDGSPKQIYDDYASAHRYS